MIECFTHTSEELRTRFENLIKDKPENEHLRIAKQLAKDLHKELHADNEAFKEKIHDQNELAKKEINKKYKPQKYTPKEYKEQPDVTPEIEKVKSEYQTKIDEANKATEIPIKKEKASTTDESIDKVEQPTKETAKDKRIADFNSKVDKAGKSIIDLLTPASTKGIKKSGLGVEEIVNAAMGIVKAANLANENIKEAIDKAIKYIKDNLAENWDGKFEQPLRDRLNDIIEPPTGNTGTVSNSDSDKPKMRSVYKNIIERSKLPEKQKKLLRDDPQALYHALPNKDAKAIALQIVEEMGVENAVAEASRRNSDLEPFEKVMILGAAMDYYAGKSKESPNEKDANHNADLEIDAQEKMQQVAQDLAKLGTSLGRGINMFNEVYKLSNIALERKIKKQVKELNKLLNPQVDASASAIKDIVQDDNVNGIGKSMADDDAQQMNDLKSKVSALEKDIADLRKQIAENTNAPAGSKKNPLNINRRTNATEYARRLKEFSQRHRAGISNDDLADLVYFGLYHIENGVTKFSQWFNLMSRQFAKYKEHLKNVYISGRDNAIQNGADVSLFDDENTIDNHFADLQNQSDAKKMVQLTKRKTIAENNRAEQNDPEKARKEAPINAAKRVRNDAANSLGLVTTKNEQTYLKRLISTIHNKAREYYKTKDVNTKNVNDILAFAIANGKSDYALWEKTQAEVESQIDADENLSDDEKEGVKEFLNDYVDSIFETLLTTPQQEEIIRQKLIDAGYSTERTINGKVVKAVDWDKVIGSAKNIKEAKSAIKKAILDVGFTEEEAKNEIDAVLAQFDNKVLDKKNAAINNYLKKGVINKVKTALGIRNTKSKVQKLIDMNNKGILDDERIKDVLAKDLGVISLSDDDLKKIRELSTLIDNPKIPSFVKKGYEEQLQYLFDSKGGNLNYLEFREFLANNRLTSVYNNIQNMTGWLRGISTYITIAAKTGSPIQTAKVFKKAFKESISDALTILLHGDISRGTSFADLTKTTEGEPRVRYLEQGKGKLLGLPDAYVKVGKKTINLNIFNTAYRGVKFVARGLESADTVPSNVISGLTQYWQIRKQLQFLHPEMSNRQIETKAYEIMNNTGLAEATKEAIEGFKEADIVPSKYQLNRAVHEINERKRNELLAKEFYDTVEETKPDAEKRLIDKGNPTPTGEEITQEAYLILGRDEPLDVVARGERQALRETGKKSTFGLAGLVLMPLNALNQKMKRQILANHNNTQRWAINAGDAAITYLLPYANSIGRWLEMGIELTPYGVLKGLAYKGGVANMFEQLDKGKITKQELSEMGDDYLIRGVQGSAMLLSGMYLMSLLNAGGDDDDEEDKVNVTGMYKNPNFPKERIQSVGHPDQTLSIKGHKIPLGLMGNAAYPLIMYQDFLDKRTNDNEKHGILYTTAAVYLTTSAQSVSSRLGVYGSIIGGIQSGKIDRFAPQLGKVAGSNVAASLIPFNRLQQEVGQLWNPKSEQSLTFGENLLQQFSIVGSLGKAHPSFDYRGREYDFGDVFTGSADGIVKMFGKSKTADKIDRKLAEIDFGATDAFRESKDEENYKYTIVEKDGTSRFMTITEYYDFRKSTAKKFNEKITDNFDIVNDVSIKINGKVNENKTKQIMNETYSDMLNVAKVEALELVQAKTGFMPNKRVEEKLDKKESKDVLKQKKRQLTGLHY
jgi:hypothetical protein